jgi:serine protease Do
MKRMLFGGVILLTLPCALLAQKEEKIKEKQKEKTMQTIIINRKVDNDEKTVIEIKGDKVMVNGKDADQDKNVHVTVQNMKGNNMYWRTPGNAMAFNFNNEGDNLFSENENRAMLGVMTEGSDEGAEIQSITEESAAEKAGLKKGDIIKRIGDKKIENSEDVTKAVRSHKPGDKVDIVISRDGKEQKVTAELGKWKGLQINTMALPRIEEMNQQMGQFNDQAEMAAPGEPFTRGFYVSGQPRLGLSIQDTDDDNGVKVLDVDDESAAEKAGIEKDDIIKSIDEKEVKGTDDVKKIIRDSGNKNSFNFKVLRDGKTENIEVKIPRKLKTTEL